jgi:hypothetical protein
VINSLLALGFELMDCISWFVLMLTLIKGPKFINVHRIILGSAQVQNLEAKRAITLEGENLIPPYLKKCIFHAF